jgi:cation transporter-like permease
VKDNDSLLLESVSTHRARLASAFVFGGLRDRRVVNDNVRRLMGSIVLAAVVCGVCVAVSFIGSILAQQEADRRAEQSSSAPAVVPAATETFPRGTHA